MLAGRAIEIRVPHDLPLVQLDAVLVERLFANLLENASKYTPAGSPIASQPATSASPTASARTPAGSPLPQPAGSPDVTATDPPPVDAALGTTPPPAVETPSLPPIGEGVKQTGAQAPTPGGDAGSLPMLPGGYEVGGRP